MGKENSIKTGTIVKTPRSLSTNTSINIGNTSSLLPSSTYQFGVVTAVNPITKEIICNAIEDNMSSQKSIPAIPLYKNKIQLPNTGSIVPLLRGPNTNVGILSHEYDKTTYYLDPIGIWQTVDNNTIVRTVSLSPPTNEVNVNKLSIKGAEIGIPNNSPELDKTTVNATQRPLPSPPPSPSLNVAPSPSVAAASPPSSNFTFRISLNYETWIADIYNNNVLIGTKQYVFINFTEASIRELLTQEAKYFGFFINNNFYPPQPNIV